MSQYRYSIYSMKSSWSLRFKKSKDPGLIGYLKTLLLFALCIPLSFSGSLQAQYEFTSPNLIWQDEFSGTAVDETEWTFQLGDGTTYGIPGWGNNEQQYYQKENATVSGGFLTITAKEETVGGLPYTSTRMNTANFNNFTYGRFEMRAKMPIGKGMWPAFWLLFTGDGLDGTGIGEYGGWAASGEIDIMEYLGDKPDEIFGTLHYGQQFPGNVFTGNDTILDSGTFNDDFHVFAIEWEPGEIRWYLDEQLYATQTLWWSEGGPYPAPFDQDFHIILNLAVGGNLPGNPDASTVFPQEMVVDYIRVYEDQALPTVMLAVDNNTPAVAGDINLTATPSATQGVAKVEFFQGEYKLGEDDTAPYELTVANLSQGAYKVRAVVTDNDGKVNYSNIEDVTVGAGGQGPYCMVPAPIPGMVEAELYDVGGQGVAYDELNSGDAALNRGSRESGNIFRSNEGVDIQPTTDMGGGSIVGFIENGEWAEYTVDVAQAGLYDVTFRLSAESSTGTLRLLFDGVDKSGPITFVPSGDFGTFIDVTVTGLDLDAGVQVMRLSFEGTGMTVNKMTFVEAVPPLETVFDDMEHGDPFGNGWFAFGGSVGGGGIAPDDTDLPPKNGGSFSLSTGWGSAGQAGFVGGFGRTNPTDLTDATHFNFWINPKEVATYPLADQGYTIEVNLQDDDDGDDAIGAPNNGADDEFQANITVGPAGSNADAIIGGGWQLISIPFTDFVDDNSFLTGGNGVLDAVPTSEGGNGQLVNVIFAIISTNGPDIALNTDYWVFTDRPATPDIGVDPTSYDFGTVRAGICSTQPFLISNDGICDLVISELNFTGTDAADFSSSAALPLTIPGGAKQFIQVTFGPTTAGPKSATLSIVSNDPDESPLEVALSGTGEEVTEILVDDLNHGAPFDNGWFAFNGDVGGGGIAPSTDTPPDVGGTNSLSTGWGSGGTAGFYGGFTKEFPVDLSGMEFFSFWIKPTVASEEYTIEINFQDDDDGDGIIPFPPDGGDDEFQYNLKVGGVDSEVTPGGGWQRVIIPLADLFDDNSFHFGGNGVFDPFSTVCGGNGQLLNIVYVVIGTGTDANFIIDQIEFLSELVGPDIDVPSPLEFGDVFVNNCSVQTLTVSNVGGTDLSVSSAALSGSGDFSILSGGAPFTVTGGGTHDIEILFTPTAEGLAEATLTIASDDPDESSVEVAITGNGSTEAVIVFDDMEHGDPGGNGWFAFGGPVGGGGIDPNFADIPPVAGGSASLQTGWGSGGNPGIFGGFGRTSPTNIDGTTYFNFWILPDAGQEYVITIQLQDDDNGDDAIPFPPTADDDEFQYDLKVGGADSEVTPGGGWQLVSIPLADFYDDNSFLPGGNGIFDPSPVACGGNGQLIAVVFGIESISGADATFRTDYWSFSNGPLGAEIAAMPSPVDFGDVVAGSCAVDTVKITNPGFADLEVSAVMIGGTDAGAFSILSGGDPFMISPGETQDIAILFSPAAEQAYSAYLSLTSNDTADSPLLVDLMGTGVEPGTIVFDDMEHGNPTPGNNGWFQFPGDPSTGGGYGPITDDLPPTLGGTTAVVTGWGGANPGIYGGFGRNFPLDISQSTHFNFWINPLDPANPNNMAQEFILQIQLQEDDNGDGIITPDQDDEYQYNLKVGGADGEVIAGGGWQFVSIPLTEFFYDNSFLFGGNQVFDPEATVCGGNGELIAIAITVQGIAPGQAANFRMDYLAFSTGPLGPELVAMPNPVDFGEVTETSCAQQVLTITNGGVVPLEIEAMNFMGIEPTPFSILEGDAPVTILPEESHEVILSFKPEDRESYEEILQIISNDTANSPYEVLLMGEGTKPGVVVFDDMEHGDPGGNGWFSFGGPVGGGGIDPNFVDLPSANGGNASLQTGWGSGGNPGVLGGFGRTSPTDIGPATHFNFWINPDAGQEYIITVQLQDDDNGDNAIPFPPTGDDDEFQYDLKVGGADAEVIPGGGWQFVSIPLADFYDDNSFLFGGNGVFDPEPVSCGGNGQLIAVIFGIETITGADATFRTDYWSFSNGPVITSFILVDADSNTDVTPIEDGDLLLLQDLPENFNIVAVVEGAEEINRVVLDLNGPVENERTERKAPYAVFGDRNGNYTGRPTEAGMYDITATPYYMDGGLVEGTCLSIDFEIGDCDIIGDVANAGPDQELDCVTGEATLQGSVTAGPMMAPYMVAWSGPNGFSTNDLTPTVTEAGVYTLTITGGVTGCVSVDEVVVEPCQEDCEPETSRFVLVNSDTNEDIMVLEDEAEIDLTIVGRALNIRAEVLCGDKTESVRMVLTGAQTRTRTENKAPYALAGDSNGNYSNQSFVPGDYTLRATPYTEKNAQGDAGTMMSITFTVQNGGPATQTGFEDPSLDPQAELSVFPVPANGEFFIDMKFFEEGVYDAAIFDVAGRVVMSQKLVYDAAAEKRFTIKSDQLAVGVYMVRVSGQSYQTWRKITIRR